ncbi:MAG: 2-C-methyl-D-erythritol 4-phosphate cytidylyltransferase [Coriobacteriia bacterium]|jgi:2-C-methyl-D-erythritol 4-phosphate cytidylyltransferase|nr:2-C-methyl-D-erythritol 4-phosphate cytidylyltransferase [Coriobacteriia bacterium]
MSERDTSVVLVAGGAGERFGRAGGKQLALLAGRPVFAHSFAIADAVSRVGLVAVVCPPARVEEYAAAVRQNASRAEVRFVAGGERRQDSVAAGLAEIPEGYRYICVHDGARPLATVAMFDQVLALLDADETLAGAIVGHASVDTLKSVQANRVISTLDRSHIWAVQTPQAFRASALRLAYDYAAAQGWEGTDDASFVERAGGTIGLVEGTRDNIKITLAEDLPIAEAALDARNVEVDR